MSLHIYIDTIPHREQRYPTCGDYWRRSGQRSGIERLEVRVSSLNNEDYEFLVAMHELIEEHLTRKRGITSEQIDEFDMAFENARAGKEERTEEPGDSPDAPYRKEHQFATNIERILAAELGIEWAEYERAISELA